MALEYQKYLQDRHMGLARVRTLLACFLACLIAPTTVANHAGLLGNTATPGNCHVRYYRQQIVDHFNWRSRNSTSQHWPQRYFLCDKYWRNRGQRETGPVLFYGRQNLQTAGGSYARMWGSPPTMVVIAVLQLVTSRMLRFT